jgi:hypothetical protein
MLLVEAYHSQSSIPYSPLFKSSPSERRSAGRAFVHLIRRQPNPKPEPVTKNPFHLIKFNLIFNKSLTVKCQWVNEGIYEKRPQGGHRFIEEKRHGNITDAGGIELSYRKKMKAY